MGEMGEMGEMLTVGYKYIFSERLSILEERINRGDWLVFLLTTFGTEQQGGQELNKMSTAT